MNLTIQLPHAEDSASVREHADRALRFAFTRFTDAITGIRLRLVDENGPRGGVDQRCRVHVALRSGGTIRVEGTGIDAPSAIYHVVARAERTIARRLSRARSERIG